MRNDEMDNQPNGLEIAIIGMSGRFPGARNLNDFWENLKNGVISVIKLKDEDIEEAKSKFEIMKQPNWVQARASMDDMEYFDPSFFGYTPKEAELMNPQMRIFHECAWEALEDSGYEPRNYKKPIGLYAGATTSVQWEVGVEISGISRDTGSLGTQQLADKDYLSTRIAYNLNLRGPVMIVQTACSTSLVAIHMACQALLNGECYIALAGGISAFLGLKNGYVFTEGSILSKDGSVRAFDAKASGTVFGNGTGVVALKVLEDAINDRDHIYAVIKATAINNDGSDKAAFPAPSVEGQVRVIRMAQQLAEVDPLSISYVETHGTGTNIGDPIEIEALTKAFNVDEHQYCAIGAVKSNVGHLDAAAGVTGLIKTALALNHRQIPPAVNFETPNPKIDFEHSPFFVNTKLRDWKNDQYPLRAGVSAFGVGGTNAHVVMEEAPQQTPSSVSRKWQLITISAKTKKSLEKNTEKLVNHLNQNPGINLPDAAYTLKVGRRVLEHRRMTVCSTSTEATEAFTTTGSEKVKTYVAKEKHRSAIFMFSGQGSQYVNMGLDLYRTEPLFREEMDRCFAILRPIMGHDIKEILYPSGTGTGSAAQLPDINQTEITQPVIFMIEYALARMLMKWGLKPFAMIGHSIGEYVAAALAEVFSLEDALKLVCLRGQLMQKMPSGSMLSMPLPEDQVIAILKDHPQLEIAAVNSSAFSVVSGPHEAVDALMAQLKEKNIDCTRLHTSHAFHSQMMEPMLAEFEQHVRKVKLNKPVLPYISNVTGTWISVEDALDPTYWTKQIRGAVRFSDGLTELLNEANAVFIEVGPGKALATFVRQHQKKAPAHLIINMVRHPKDDISDDKFLMEKIGELWLYGLPLDWHEFYAHEKRNRISMPTYSFDTQHFWFKDDPFVLMGTEMRQLQSIIIGQQMPMMPDMGKKQDLSDWFYVPTWKLLGITTAQKTKAEQEEGRVLVFLGNDALGAQVLKQIQQQGKPVTTVTTGTQFVVTGDSAFEINPSSRDDYRALFEHLKKQQQIPRTIAHLWNLSGLDGGAPVTEVLDPHEVAKSQELGFYSLFYMAQVISELSISSPIRLSILSVQMQEVTGGELLRPGQATLLGPLRVIPQECPNIKCKSIDIVPPPAGSELEKNLVARLCEDFFLQNDDIVVAYRGSQRWVQTFEPFRLEQSNRPSPRLRVGGVYLITGGLGGLGLVFAQDLAKQLKPKLILTGRSAFPAKDQWSSWLAERGEADSTSTKIREVQRLEEMGAEVMVGAAEVSNLEQMKAVVQQAEEKFGNINGVIHAAGVPDGGMLQLRKREDLEPVLLPKIEGTLVLDQIFTGKPLDMMILFSSIIAVAPPLGQIGYSGANSFLDAFAHLRTAKGNYTVSINWDGWQEVGMVVNMMKKMAAGGGAAAQAIPDLPKKDAPHPFFQYRMEKDANQGIFISSFLAENYWALDEHRILIGKPSLPGTGFLELIHAAFKIQTGVDRSEIRDLGFLRPLMLEEKGEKEVQALLKRQGTGNQFEFTIKSRPKGAATDWENHASGIVAAVDDASASLVKYNIDEIREQCREKETIDVTQVKEVFNSPELFGPRWRCCKWIMRGKDQWLARLELPGDFTADIDAYPLHPALLDVAVGFPAFIPEVFKGETYLPFSYKRIKVSKPLTANVYSLARYSQHQLPAGDTREVLVFDVIIMDDEGSELVNIEGYTFRKVDVPARPAAASPAQAEIKEPAAAPVEPQINIIPRSEAESFSVFIGKVGELESFGFMPFSRRLPRPEYGEIEFEVSYVGVNFKDVLFSLGILPLPSARHIKLGFECAGTVVRVAEGVDDYKIGDEVVALVAPCYMEHVTLPRDLTMKLPKGMAAAEAVTMPMAYITAYYSLIKKADLQPGERVLIHSAAGGVGMAAVKIAQWKGAEIFATAGTPEKRDYLRSLGIQHVMDSRSLDFADKVMEITNGEGVDVVLNSLAGDFIPKSISLLRQYGRFLELGVKDFFNDTKLGMRPFMNSLSYFAITMTTEIPNIFSVWKEVVEHIYNGHFTPLPNRIFPLEKIGDAFKYMLQGVHTGRILLSLENKDKVVLQMPPEEEDTGADMGFNALYARDTVFSPHTVGRAVPGEKKTAADTAKAAKPKSTPVPSVPAAPAPAVSAPAPVSTAPAAPSSASRFNLENGILPAQGVDAFNRILHETLPQLVVSTRDFRIPAGQLEAFSAAGRGMGGQMPFGAESTAGDAAPTARPEMLTEYVAPRDDIERKLVDIFKSLLGFEAGVMDDFFEMGGDSLKASGVINKVNHTFGITVPVSEMFVRKNISGLAEYIRGTQSEDTKLEQMLKEIEAMPLEKP